LGRIDQEVASRAVQENADPRLGGLLGDAGVQASQMVANKFKLNPSIAMKLIPILAPIILGALTKQRDSVSPGTVPGAGSGSGLDGLAGMIDKDGDGSILDDVAGMFLGGQSGAGSSGGGLLGSILGGLFGRKR